MIDYKEEQKRIAKVMKLKMKSLVRYYYWEWVPHYGIRQMGVTNGYNNIEELKKDQVFNIQNQKERGYPVVILKAKVIQQI